ncbi:MAG: FABP family protein [Betaproteobacteria bacterium]|nr:FABP family protein [Betaproteobacteria bacterium]
MDNLQEIGANLVGLGPLAGLVGVWEGSDGTDISPGKPDRKVNDTERSYRERWAFEVISPAVENHDQKLRQVVCDTNAWRGTRSTAGKEAGEAFHAQRGYWIWDAATKMVLNSFSVPRGIVINAGGTAEPDATCFELVAQAGSETYGICQNPYLLENFKVVRYSLKLTLNRDGSFDYEQDTQLEIKGRGLLHHTDANHLKRKS